MERIIGFIASRGVGSRLFDRTIKLVVRSKSCARGIVLNPSDSAAFMLYLYESDLLIIPKKKRINLPNSIETHNFGVC